MEIVSYTELSKLRDEIHAKSREYLVFKYERRKSENYVRLYAALDTLLDINNAVSALIHTERKATMLECYGFLQVISSMQDAVEELGKSVGIADWKPSHIDSLKKLRTIRNRVSGHPTWSDHNGPRSSSIINSHDIGRDEFIAIIYYADNSEKVLVNFVDYVSQNCSSLIPQLKNILQRMDKMEEEFRSNLRKLDLSTFFDKDNYLIQRLHAELSEPTRIGQAIGHANILTERLKKLRVEISKNLLQSEIPIRKIDYCLHGLDRLHDILNQGAFTAEDQFTYDLVYDGWCKGYQELKITTASVYSLIQSKAAA